MCVTYRSCHISHASINKEPHIPHRQTHKHWHKNRHMHLYALLHLWLRYLNFSRHQAFTALVVQAPGVRLPVPTRCNCERRQGLCHLEVLLSWHPESEGYHVFMSTQQGTMNCSTQNKTWVPLGESSFATKGVLAGDIFPEMTRCMSADF